MPWCGSKCDNQCPTCREGSKSLEEAFAEIKQDEEIKALRMENARLRQVISCAYCPTCGEEIADQQYDINADGHLCHAQCVKEEEDE